VVLSPLEKCIKAKIEAVGVPLKDWDINIYRGILTGYNEAFIIDGETKEKLIAEDPNSAEIIRPILRGKDIKKYDYKFADKWLINILNGFTNKNRGTKDPEKFILGKYPAVYKYFIEKHNEYESKPANERKKSKGLKDRDDQGEYWWELRACAYSEDFSKQKIIFQEMVQESSFMIDDEGTYFCLDTGRIITGKDIEYLIAILNSKLFFFAVKNFYGGGGLGETGVRMKHTFFEKFHCPLFDSETKQKIGKMLKIQDYQGIDNLIYEMYSLSEEEMQVIESQ
jgi:hypothetical protein